MKSDLHKSIQVLIEWIWPMKLRDRIKFSWSLRLKDDQSLSSVKKEWGIFTIWSSYKTLVESSFWKNQLKSLRFIYNVTLFKYLGQLQKAFKSQILHYQAERKATNCICDQFLKFHCRLFFWQNSDQKSGKLTNRNSNWGCG